MKAVSNVLIHVIDVIAAHVAATPVTAVVFPVVVAAAAVAAAAASSAVVVAAAAAAAAVLTALSAGVNQMS